MKTNEKINPYKIHWLILNPISGKCTKRDLLILRKSYYNCNKITDEFFSCHFPSKEIAEKAIKEIKNKLNKPYLAYIITDKQFGMIEFYDSKIKNLHLTTKQFLNHKLV